MTTVANIRTFRGDHRSAILIDRTTPWGNPFRALAAYGGHDRAWAVRQHRLWWYSPDQRELRRHARAALTDQALLCHCWPADCHGDTIANYLNHVVPFYAELSA